MRERLKFSFIENTGPENLFPQFTKESHQEVILTFENFFTRRGYQEFSPEEILPQRDSSILFTNSTIVPLKQLVRERRVPSPGCFVVQPCLRTQNLQIIYEDKIVPEYMSYFTMLGTLAAPKRYEEVVEEAWELLTQSLKISKEDIKILISSQDRKMLWFWEKMEDGPIIEEDSKQESYYQWAYGLPGISGRGLTFSVRYKNTETFRDIGNIIAMKTEDGETIGYEFGFGVETILSRMLDLTRPIEAATVSQAIPFEEGLKEKFADALACVTVLYRQSLRPGRGGPRHILKKYVKGLSYLGRRLQIGQDNLIEVVSHYEQIEFGNPTDIAEKVATDLDKFEAKIGLFEDYVRSQFTAHTIRGEVNSRFFAKLQKRAEQYGLPPVEYEMVVKKVIPACYLKVQSVK